MKAVAISIALLSSAGAFASSSPRPDGAPAARDSRCQAARVDLDFTDADVHTVLRALSHAGGVNIVTTRDVKGRLTIKMRAVPWDKALDLVVRGLKLSYERMDGTIYIRPAA